tara:strand:- start:7304 stop:8080 length:777 start_codon:yes stop_codon:yes gene_type:complete
MVQYKTDYDKWAEYYDLIYEIMPPNDSKLYAKYIQESNKVLEMGIGTGRILLEFINTQVQWTGIDKFEGMIEKCREKIEPLQPLKENVFLIKEDMTRLDIKEKDSISNKKYDLVIYPSHSLMSVGDEEVQIKALCSGLKHLAKDGVLIFDLHNPNNYLKSDNYGLLGTKKINNDNYNLYSKSNIDIEKKLHSNFQILEKNDNKIKLKSHEYFLYLEDVIRLSDELNFEIISLYGNYNLDSFNEFSEEMIFICKKKHGQ